MASLSVSDKSKTPVKSRAKKAADQVATTSNMIDTIVYGTKKYFIL
jgi:hypothetical protein